jgi:aspartate 1-decarboxylase
MHIEMIRTKIHQARVTAAVVDYVGSIGIDTDLLAQARMYPYEKVLVVDVENGSRLETYIIPAPAGSGEISLNGAAARLVSPGDRVIIMAFANVTFPPPEGWEPRVLIMDDTNAILEIRGPERWED